MKHLLSLTFVAAMAFSLASTVQAHNNNGCNNGGNNGPSNGCNNGGSNWGNNGGCQVNLSCDAGGPYSVAGELGSVTVQLDGTQANGAQTWHWSTNFPGAVFNDASLPNATLTIPVGTDCSFNVNLSLTVTRNSVSKTCCTTIRVRDHVKPVITCPEFVKLTDGMETGPATAGYATATDNCDQNVQVTYCDKIIHPACAADRAVYQIERTWKAVDNDCNVAKCTQIINIDRLYAYMDVLPGVCQNLYNRGASANLPIAIVGLSGFNAAQIQWSSVRLFGLHCAGGPVAPECFELADVATPFFNSPSCACTNENGDGTPDLVAKFKRSKINQALGLANVAPGTAIPVIITGRLCNGIDFLAQDCIVVQ